MNAVFIPAYKQNAEKQENGHERPLKSFLFIGEMVVARQYHIASKAP